MILFCQIGWSLWLGVHKAHCSIDIGPAGILLEVTCCCIYEQESLPCQVRKNFAEFVLESKFGVWMTVQAILEVKLAKYSLI